MLNENKAALITNKYLIIKAYKLIIWPAFVQNFGFKQFQDLKNNNKFF